MSEVPAPFAALLEEFRLYDRHERAEMLIEYADQFREVPPAVARRPFGEEHRAPRCESEAFVWAVDRPDGTLDFHFAVENPQGLSARAWCRILEATCDGQPLDQVAAIPGDSIFTIFGRDLSMGKGQGLLGILDVVQHEVKQRRLRQRT